MCPKGPTLRARTRANTAADRVSVAESLGTPRERGSSMSAPLCISRLAAALLLVLVLSCGCSGESGTIRLTLATFGEFGYRELVETFERENPGITVVTRVTDFDSHHKALATALGTGRGAPDVVAIEEQYLPSMRQAADKFVDLSTFGADKLRSRWAEWKWAGGLAGDRVIGLGTDMGGLAMCYRRDLFAAAGLPKIGRAHV